MKFKTFTIIMSLILIIIINILGLDIIFGYMNQRNTFDNVVSVLFLPIGLYFDYLAGKLLLNIYKN